MHTFLLKLAIVDSVLCNKTMIDTTSKSRPGNYSRSAAKHGVPPVFISKVLLEDSHAYSFLYCLWQMSCYRGRVEEFQQEPCGLYRPWYLLSGPNRIDLSRPDKEHADFSFRLLHTGNILLK